MRPWDIIVFEIRAQNSLKTGCVELAIFFKDIVENKESWRFKTE